jgi:hypothetical protein
VTDEFIIPTYKLTLKAAQRMIVGAVIRAEELNVTDEPTATTSPHPSTSGMSGWLGGLWN